MTKIRFFFILVCCLFGALHLGWLVAFWMDRRDRRKIEKEIFDPAKCGFALEGEAWTWSLTQEPHSDPVLPVKGTAVNFCACLGVPYARIRSAIPEDLLDTVAPTHVMVGRELGLSPQFFAGGDKDVLKQKIAQLFDGGCVSANAVAPGDDVEKGGKGGGGGDHAPAPAALDVSRMASTALVVAFLNVRNVFPPNKLNELIEKCAALFAEVRDPSGRSFRELQFLFVAMLHQDHIPRDRDWFSRARLWRLILGQQCDGSWHLRGSLAMALLSRGALGGEDGDCPLRFDEKELRRSLEECRAQARLPAGFEGERVWATLLAVAYLQTSRFSWLADGENNHTIVDRGLDWLESRGLDELPRLHQLAADKVAAWARTQDECVKRIRAAERRADTKMPGVLQHFAGEVVRMVRMEHEVRPPVRACHSLPPPFSFPPGRLANPQRCSRYSDGRPPPSHSDRPAELRVAPFADRR